jgi:outer membrane lipoprotein
MKRSLTWRIILVAFAFLSGCAPVISRELSQQIDKTIDFKTVSKNPESFRNEMVLWGGVIVSARNLKEGTLIEILQKPLGFGNEPALGDYSEGRFLALFDGYLDTAVYSKDREVTVAGVVKGRRTQRLDEIEYAYPLIAIKELHLWAEKTEVRPEPYIFYPFPYRYPHHRYFPRW